MALHYHQPQTPGKITKPRNNSIANLRRIMDSIDADPALKLCARADYKCCGSCASCSIAEAIEKQKKRGGVFWHRQGYNGRTVHLNYGPYNDKRETNKRRLAIGDLVVAALQREGITQIEWNRDPNKTIQVTVDEEHRFYGCDDDDDDDDY